jgi:photosystem II stability/assembly factor-like uncharacterized protein
MSHREAPKAQRVLSVFCAFLWLTIPRIEPLRFEVTTNLPPASGRLFIILSKSDRPEPRTRIGETGLNAPPILGRDIMNFGPGVSATIDKTAVTFPIANLDALPAGDYYVQALFDSKVDVSSVNAPGNRYSDVQRVYLDPRTGGTIKLSVTKTIPAEQPPSDDQYVKYVRIQSDLLTRFHKRPIYLRAGVILPKDYGVANRRWPLRVHTGGYGTRYTAVRGLMAPNSEFRRMWLADDTPRFIFLQLDGDGPYGDSYQVNSDNSGPYGDAITRELIPYVEKNFHALGEPYARVLDGGSTGGWVSLALKIFYPDFFNAVWSSCPDGVDFRAFQLIDIYNDQNAYFDKSGVERPSKRDNNGRVEFTIRHECQMENVMGAGDSWTMSGQQWGAWNATYGPRGPDGRPVPLWDAKTGVINKAVVDHWKKYDLRMVLEENWKTLGPKLSGKIHISVGEADDYYLNNAVHLLDDFLKRANPPADARITYGPGRGHCWSSISEAQMMAEMAVAVEQANPHVPRWQEQKSGTAARLRGVSAVNENVAWASGSNGTVVRTVDGGMHWQVSVIPGAADLDFRDVHGVDANTAYALSAGEGEKSRIYKTNDGGTAWSLQFTNHEPKGFFDAFAFWDANNGIAFSDPVGGRFLVIRTADGGATWKEIPRANMPGALPDEAAFAASGSSIAVSGKDHVWIATGGSAARVFHSSDRGLTWSVAVTPITSGSSSAGVFSIYAASPELVFVVGGDYRKENESSLNVARSVDGGRTWLPGPQLPGYRSAIAAVRNEAAAVYIAVGPSGTDFLRASSGSWINIGTVGYDAVGFLPNIPTGWAVGQGGRIARWDGVP